MSARSAYTSGSHVDRAIARERSVRVGYAIKNITCRTATCARAFERAYAEHCLKRCVSQRVADSARTQATCLGNHRCRVGVCGRWAARAGDCASNRASPVERCILAVAVAVRVMLGVRVVDRIKGKTRLARVVRLGYSAALVYSRAE